MWNRDRSSTIESEMPCLYNIETIDCQENHD